MSYKEGELLEILSKKGCHHSFNVGDIVKYQYTDSDGDHRCERVSDGHKQFVSSQDLKRKVTPSRKVGDMIVSIRTVGHWSYTEGDIGRIQAHDSETKFRVLMETGSRRGDTLYLTDGFDFKGYIE